MFHLLALLVPIVQSSIDLHDNVFVYDAPDYASTQGVRRLNTVYKQMHKQV